jgi:peptidoglycan lytic transglycosylase
MMVFRRPIHAGFVLLALSVCGAAGCARRSVRVQSPAAPARVGSIETGVASWYGTPYHGRRAASGEVYDMEQLTAAHRRLPFETWVEVTNLSNGRSVDVRINDRGPFARGRIIDLSQAAARDIGMLGPGTARVQLRVIAPPAGARPASAPKLTTPVAWYAVQAGAFADRNRADSLCAAMVEAFAEARVVQGDDTPPLWHVLVGREMTIEQANELAVRVRREGGQAAVVPERHSPQIGD